MADMTTIKGRIAETIYPNGKGAITAESHQALLLEMVDDINAKKADKKEVTFVDEKVTILANETNSSVQNLQDELSELSEKIDNLPQGDEFDKQGNYPLLRVGTADDLAGRGESVPASFGFRASGGKSIKDGRAYIKSIKGNSVVWNNIAEWRGVGNTNYGITVTYDNGYIHVQGVAENTVIPFYSVIYDDVSKPGMFIKTHRYMVSGKGDKFYLSIYGDVSITGPNVITEKTGESVRLTISSKNLTIGEEINETFPIRVVDLTQLFQAGNEPTTFEEYEARKPIVADEYAYNEGEVIHCNTESIKSVGDNAWDEEWESGIINYSTGIDTYSANYCRTVGYTKVIPNEQYYISFPTASYSSDLVVICYDENKAFIQHIGGGSANKTFRIPTNCHYIRFTWTETQYANNIMLTLVHSGWKQDTDAGYQPYWQDTLPLPIIRKYFPDGMKSAGSAHDEIRFNKASGKWEAVQRIGSVDMGSMAWSYDSANQVFTSCTIMDLMTHPAEVSERNKGLLCSKYSPSSTYVASTMDDKSWLRIPKSVTIKDTSYTDAATLKADLQGVMLYYELAEPIVTELDEADQNFRDYYNVADFGTEQSQSSVPSAAFSADIIYQFNAVDMIREHELEITELQSIIATMQAQLTSLINGGQ